jgi:hypothetical protein
MIINEMWMVYKEAIWVHFNQLSHIPHIFRNVTKIDQDPGL